MVRAFLALVFFAIALVVLVVPIFFINMVYPTPRLVAAGAAFVSRSLLAICGVRLTIEGGNVIQDETPKFFVGNHQSTLDIPILLAALGGRVRFLTKQSLFRIPVLGWVLMRYGHVPIDRSRPRAARENLDRLLEQLPHRPGAVVAFPEGTRSPDGRLLPFRRGTMKICRRAGLTIVPFSIDGSGAICRRREFRVRPGPVRLRLGGPISADEVASLSMSELHDRVRRRVAEGLGQAVEDAQADGAPIITAEEA